MSQTAAPSRKAQPVEVPKVVRVNEPPKMAAKQRAAKALGAPVRKMRSKWPGATDLFLALATIVTTAYFSVYLHEGIFRLASSFGLPVWASFMVTACMSLVFLVCFMMIVGPDHGNSSSDPKIPSKPIPRTHSEGKK